ncbi:TylF/MycF family methyltransferase [Synechocystis sp. B12]|nr:TylF/MycF family methyltransferase [Synechocystis sp. B12]
MSFETIRQVKKFTMTSDERLFALINATRYILDKKIDGSFVECGVWKGGSMMSVAYTLVERQVTKRQLYLFDTFDGMSEPTDKDYDIFGSLAKKLLQKNKKQEKSSIWCYSPLEEVQQNLSQTKYPTENIIYVQGKVEETIPETLPNKIALLRLDTDWYESTKHELVHLFPKLVQGGVLIIDDYGHWQGCRKAVDEYFEQNNISILLNRIDYTGRIGIKV